MEERARVACDDHRRPEFGVVHRRARHGVDAKRPAVFRPRCERQNVVRQSAANDLGCLGEDVTDVERAGHRVQEAVE